MSAPASRPAHLVLFPHLVLLGVVFPLAGDRDPAGPVFSMNFEENPARAALTTGSVAVIEGRWKLVRYLGSLHYPAMPPLRDGLYDLSQDPGETVNRMETNPEQARRLGQLINEQLKRHGGPLP